jgi:hypothetical protein
MRKQGQGCPVHGIGANKGKGVHELGANKGKGVHEIGANKGKGVHGTDASTVNKACVMCIYEIGAKKNCCFS